MSDYLDPDAMNLSEPSGSDFDQYDNMVLDLEGTSDELPKFEPIPPGVYDAIVENVEFGPSQSSGNPMLTWQFRITQEPYENRVLYFWTVLNKDFGVRMLKRVLVRIAPDMDMSNFSPRAFADSGAVLGLPCRLKVGIRTRQGERRNNIKDVLPPQGPEGFFDN